MHIIRASSMKQDFFPIVWNSNVTHQLKLSSSHQWVLEKHECTIRHSWYSSNAGTSCCCFLRKYTEAYQSPRSFALQPADMHFAVLDPLISHEQRRLFPFRFDHNGRTNLFTNVETEASTVCDLKCSREGMSFHFLSSMRITSSEQLCTGIVWNFELLRMSVLDARLWLHLC